MNANDKTLADSNSHKPAAEDRKLLKKLQRLSKNAMFMMTLSVVALILTIYGLISSFVTSKEQEKKLNYAIDNISTAYIANFPDHLRHISKTLSEGCSKLSVCTDVFPYAIFSSPRLFEEYLGNLLMLAKNGSTVINYVVQSQELAEETRISFVTLEYNGGIPDKSTADSLFANIFASSKEYGLKYSFLRKYEFSHPEPEINAVFERINAIKADYFDTARSAIRYDDYYRMIDLISAEIASSLKSFHPENVTIKYSDRVSSVYYWLFDDMKAIYVFSSDNITETAYRTTEPTLVSKLCEDMQQKLKTLQ